MNRIALAASACACLCLALWIASRAAPIHPQPAPAIGGAPAGQEEPLSDLLDSPRPPEREADLVARPPSSTACSIVGRLVFEDGSPAAGVPLTLDGSEAQERRILAAAERQAPVFRSTTSAADGRFELSFVPAPSQAYKLVARLVGNVPVERHWRRIAPGERLDAGDLVLRPAGRIVGRIVDMQGRPALGRWSVHAVDDYYEGVGERDRSVVGAHDWSDPLTGRFELRDAAPGALVVHAQADTAVRTEPLFVVLQPGATLEVELHHSGPSMQGRILVQVSGGPWTRLLPMDGGCPPVRLHGPAGDVERGPTNGSWSQNVVYVELPVALYTAEFEHPQWLPWKKDGLQPGDATLARLEPAGRLKLSVVDAESGLPIAKYRLRSRIGSEHRTQAGGPALPAGGDPLWIDANYVRRDLDCDGDHPMWPVTHDVVVEADGYAPLELPALPFTAGAALERVAALGRGHRVTLHVLHNGAPLAGAEVSLQPATTEESSLVVVRTDRGDARRQRTDAEGRATWTALPDGTWDVLAQAGWLSRASVEGIELSGGSSQREIVLDTGNSGALAGRLLGLAPGDERRLQVEAWPTELDEAERTRARWLGWLPGFKGGSDVAADGGFRIAHVPPGEVDVLLVQLGRQERRTLLGRVHVAAGGEARADFQLPARATGLVRLRVLFSGQPAAGALLSLVDPQALREVLAQAKLDAAGSAETRLRPGPFRARVAARDDSWETVAPGAWDVPPGGTTMVDLRLEPAAGELLLVDAETLLPLAERAFVLEGRAPGEARRRTTDTQGRVRLELPPDIYELKLVDGPAGRAAGIAWTPAGPASPEVAVRRDE